MNSDPPDDGSKEAVKPTEEANALRKRGEKKENKNDSVWSNSYFQSGKSYLGDDVVHVGPRVVGAVIVAEAVQDGLGFELVLVSD